MIPCQEIREAVTGSKAKAKRQSDSHSALLKGVSGAGSRYAKLDQAMEKGNQDYIEDQEQQQRTIMRDQDTQLEEVGQTIGVLKSMGTLISTELEDQNRLLDDFNDDIETTGDKLKHTLQKLDRTLNITKDGKQSCCICLLILTVIILIIVYLT